MCSPWFYSSRISPPFARVPLPSDEEWGHRTRPDRSPRGARRLCPINWLSRQPVCPKARPAIIVFFATILSGRYLHSPAAHTTSAIDSYWGMRISSCSSLSSAVGWTTSPGRERPLPAFSLPKLFFFRFRKVITNVSSVYTIASEWERWEIVINEGTLITSRNGPSTPNRLISFRVCK